MATVTGLKPTTRNRSKIPESYTWDLSQIYPDWSDWEAALAQLQGLMDSYQKLKGTLAEGPQRILEASRLSDELGQLAYRVYQYPGLMQSQDTRDNAVQGRLEQVRLALAAFRQATAWYTPELLEIPEETMRGWLDETPDLAPYRFGIEESYRMQRHVLDEGGERLLAYAATFNGTPAHTYSMLADADVEFSTVILRDGTEMVASHANYSLGLHSLRVQSDREKLFKAHFEVCDGFPTPTPRSTTVYSKRIGAPPARGATTRPSRPSSTTTTSRRRWWRTSSTPPTAATDHCSVTTGSASRHSASTDTATSTPTSRWWKSSGCCRMTRSVI